MRKIWGVPTSGLSAAVVLSMVAIGVGSADASPKVGVASRFTHNSESWLVTGDPVSPDPTYVSTGGNPGGFIQTTDGGLGGFMYWSAPAKFLGDQSAAYGGSVQFDLRQETTGRALDASDVILKGGGLRLTFNTANDPTADWTHYRVSLREKGWLNGSVPATRADMQKALGSLSSLLIRAEFAGGIDVDDLDNVALKPPKASPR